MEAIRRRETGEELTREMPVVAVWFFEIRYSFIKLCWAGSLCGEHLVWTTISFTYDGYASFDGGESQVDSQGR